MFAFILLQSDIRWSQLSFCCCQVLDRVQLSFFSDRCYCLCFSQISCRGGMSSAAVRKQTGCHYLLCSQVSDRAPLYIFTVARYLTEAPLSLLKSGIRQGSTIFTVARYLTEAPCIISAEVRYQTGLHYIYCSQIFDRGAMHYLC